MPTPDVSASLKHAVAAERLREKGRFARAAEKFGSAVAAAAQELGADDCLIVANLRASQSCCFACHFGAPTLSMAENAVALHAACEQLVPCMETLTRRKEAGTLLPGSCRPAEVSWWRAYVLQNLLDNDRPADVAHAFADALAEAVGTETYCFAASACQRILVFVRDEPQLVLATFLASALDLLASQPCEPLVVHGQLLVSLEFPLATTAQKFLQNDRLTRQLDPAAATLLNDAWRRVSLSGVLERRLLGQASQPLDPSKSVNAARQIAAAEAAARGLHTCALAGCAAKEVHAAQFKKCGACKTVAYCCKEHQVEDWPSHKAACKAARKAAAAKDGS